MSTVFCSERNCVYQKDGLCELNTVRARPEHLLAVSSSVPPTSSCLYFRPRDAKFKPKNEVQNR